MNLNDHVDERKCKANNALYLIKTLGAEDTKMDASTKTHLYKTYVRPVLTYGLDAAPITTQIDKLLRYENIMVKKLFKINKKSHTKKLLAALGIEKLEDFILKIKLNLYVNLLNNEYTRQIAQYIGNQIDSWYYNNPNRSPKDAPNKHSFITEIMKYAKALSYETNGIIQNIKKLVREKAEDAKKMLKDVDVLRIQTCLKYQSITNQLNIQNILKIDTDVP